MSVRGGPASPVRGVVPGVCVPENPGRIAESVENPGNLCGEIPGIGIVESPCHGRACAHGVCPPDYGTIGGPPDCGRARAPRVERRGSVCPPDTGKGGARGFWWEVGRGRCGCYGGGWGYAAVWMRS